MATAKDIRVKVRIVPWRNLKWHTISLGVGLMVILGAVFVLEGVAVVLGDTFATWFIVCAIILPVAWALGDTIRLMALNWVAKHWPGRLPWA